MGKNIIDKIRMEENTGMMERRKVAALSAVGLADFSMISLYQLGLIRSLPDIPAKIFDSNQVNGSKDAVVMGMPDGPISLGLYAASILLATAGAKKKKPGNVFDWFLGGVVVAQAAAGVQYLFTMATKQKKICLYCVTGAILNFAALPSVWSLFKKRKK